MSTSPPAITVLGLGLMGRPMARALARAGFAVRGWNRSPVEASALPEVALCSSFQEAAQAQICLLMLTDSPAVGAVIEALLPHLRAGQLVLDMGTSDPTQSIALASRLAEAGIGWVDAPVSGGVRGAESATLSIMAGATEADFSRAQPVLSALGRVVRVGGPGAGHVVKLVNQVIVALTIEAVAEAVRLAEAAGLDASLVQQALRGGFADSTILQQHGTRMIERSFAPGGRSRHQLKDLRLARGLAAQLGLSLPHLDSVTERFERLVAAGGADLDHAALFTLLLGKDQERG